jgi:putative flippase GtrA
LISKKLLAFSLVGLVGFAVDAVLLVLLTAGGWSAYSARAVSFPAAVAVTWLLNRRYAFSSKHSTASAGAIGNEYVRYFLVQALGALVNLGVFAAILAMRPSMIAYPVIALAVGALAGLLVNFAGAELWVFRLKRAET